MTSENSMFSETDISFCLRTFNINNTFEYLQIQKDASVLSMPFKSVTKENVIVLNETETGLLTNHYCEEIFLFISAGYTHSK